MLDVCLLGCGGMMPLPYRYLTALMTRFNGSSMLIDCGEGTQVAIKEKGWSFKPIDVICFTHYHGDHISGLPGLLLTMGNADRTEPLTLIGPKGLERVVSCLRGQIECCIVKNLIPFHTVQFRTHTCIISYATSFPPLFKFNGNNCFTLPVVCCILIQ